MREGWEMKRLGDVLKLEYGKPLGNNKRNPNGKYPIYGANGEKGRTNEFYYNKKTIIVGRKGSAGEINLTDEKFWPLDVTYFATFDEKKYNLMFLFHLLSFLNLPQLAKGVKPGINRNEVYSIEAKFPSLAEQQRIVAILDEVFAAIAKAKANADQNLKNAKELFESYLQAVFENKGQGWEEKRLGEIIKLEYGKPLDNTLRDLNGLYPLYGANGIKGRTNEFYYSKKTIIVGRKGSAGEINLTEEKFWPLDVTYFVKFDENKYDLLFLFYLLSNKRLTTLAKGVKPGINRNEVYSLTVSVPPLKEQQAIVKKLDALSAETKKLEAIYQKKIEDLEELKKSVLQKAFRGELIEEIAIA